MIFVAGCEYSLFNYGVFDGNSVDKRTKSLMKLQELQDNPRKLKETIDNATINPVVRLSQSDFEECLTVYRLLHHRLVNKSDESNRVIAKGYLNVICSILFNYWRNANSNVKTVNSRPRDLFRRFLEKVQTDYHSHRSLKHYADCLCVTPKYLSMVVKQESGRNASDFIDELVIFESKALLMDGRYSVEQVADMMQFPNPSFFTRFFKRLCGVAPSTYRKNSHLR